MQQALERGASIKDLEFDFARGYMSLLGVEETMSEVVAGRIICLAMVHCHISNCILAGDRIVQGERASSPSLYLSLIVETNAQNPATKQHEDTNKEALPIAQGGH